MIDIFEAFRQIGVDIVDVGNSQQIHCPFHGDDVNKSMRVYPEQDNAYCWVCHRTFNPVAVIAEGNEIDYREAITMIRAQSGDVSIQRPTSERQRFDDHLHQVLTAVNTHREDLIPEIYDILTTSAKGGRVSDLDKELDLLEAELLASYTENPILAMLKNNDS